MPMSIDEPFASADVDLLDHEPSYADLVREASEQRDRADNLEIALGSARCIGMAMGIIMARLRLGEPEAFRVLQHLSQTTHRKVREIAEEIVYTGTLPISDGRRSSHRSHPAHPMPDRE
jgi:tetrahydromethanopterin S-methyltransferase subunit F